MLLKEYSSTAPREDETDLDDIDDIPLAPRITRSRAAIVAPAVLAAPAAVVAPVVPAAAEISSAARKEKVKALLGELVDVLLV